MSQDLSEEDKPKPKEKTRVKDLSNFNLQNEVKPLLDRFPEEEQRTVEEIVAVTIKKSGLALFLPLIF